jgi:ATP-dependent DNA helicase DinG
MAVPLRFFPPAATELRRAIRDAGGVEVFAIGDIEDSKVVRVTVTCRGTENAVPALLDRPRTGQVVIHNHPSGDLRPSSADLHLAGLYGDDGIGVVIVDSQVQRDNWVVEPHAVRQVRVDPAAVIRVFCEALPHAIPGHEPRQQQIDMALAVLATLHEDRPLVFEAGTGTGKSLAYLVPAALWALANDSKVVISTFTKNLQGQLLSEDLPVLARAGIEVRSAVLQGRNNYLCKRRLGLAVAEDGLSPDHEREPLLSDLAAWDTSTAVGSRSDLPFDVPPQVWERVESDTDLTLRVRCPHYEVCHYYQARRNAAAAHLIVVNHALLVADLGARREGGPGVIPTYKRVILDEAHHLEDAATGALADRLTGRAITRALAPLLARGRRPGALEALARQHAGGRLPLSAEAKEALERALGPSLDAVQALRDEGPAALAALRAALPGSTPMRIREETLETPGWRQELEPPILRVLGLLEGAGSTLAAVAEPFDEIALPEADANPLLEVQRARRRLASQRTTVERLLDVDGDTCRYLAPGQGRAAHEAHLHVAPVRVAPVLRQLLWDKLPGAVATSATLTVAGSFKFWEDRVGLREAEHGTVVSPFDYPRQAILGLPRDLPAPDEPGYLEASTAILVEAVRMSWGGTFVLCTSYEAVRQYGAALRDALPVGWPVLLQDGPGKEGLLHRFRENRRSILVATDTFWEGVSVRGVGLRQVIVPRLPFRVPTDPLHEARLEREQQEGRDPFRSLTLPSAVLRMRQGFGRLIRSQQDRGVVLLLDRRLHDRTYGTLILRSLPPAEKAVGPWAMVRERLTSFWSDLAEVARLRRGFTPPTPDPLDVPAEGGPEPDPRVRPR